MIALECCLANAIAQRAQRSVENRVSTQPGGGSIPRNVTIAGRLNENSRHHIPRGAEQPLYVIDFAQFDPQTLCGDISRSEERRVGKECVRTCRCRWSPYNKKKKHKERTRNKKTK